MHGLRLLGIGALAVLIPAIPSRAGSTQDLIATVKSVGPKGEGHPAAIRAVAELSQGSAKSLTPILEALDDAGALAANWLRGAFEAIADREFNATGKLPARELEAFVVNRQHDPHARRLAYEWLLQVDPGAEDRLIPQMLRDRGAEFRRDAVQRLIARAVERQANGDENGAKNVFREALQGATDDDQVQAIVKPLKELGESVDLQKHFGFVTRWKLIGPFENHDLVGFDAVYPPEEELDFEATYTGKDGRQVRWVEHTTAHDYGMVDLRKAIPPFKGAVTYAVAEFQARAAEDVEVRLSTQNAWKLWINGEFQFGRDEYHRGTQFDQYQVPVKLRAGKNVLLLKICEDEQKEDWAQDYYFQLRISDASGAAIEPAGD
jgi:hypothetical protein